MRGKKIAVLSSSAALLISTWLPMLTVVGAGTALMAGCSSERSDTRQEARTEARTSERAEERVEERHD